MKFKMKKVTEAEDITLTRRVRLMRSLSLRNAEFLGSDCKSENRSFASASNSLFFQKLL